MGDTNRFFFYSAEVKYTFGISGIFSHEFDKWPLADYLKGPFLTFAHNINFDSVNWIGNFRSGIKADINNSFTYNFFYSDAQAWQADLDISAAFFFIVSDFLGISARLLYRHWFFTDFVNKLGYHDEAGDALRGIINTEIIANLMLSLNLDFSFKILEFRPSKWIKDSSFWRTFDFDFHAGPFFDAAIYNNPSNNEGFKNVLLTAGVEAFMFPLRWQSFFLNISYGHNFSLGEKKSKYELFIGMEAHY